MDYRKELAKWGYNKGNSIDVEILINEILPSLFSQQERSYSEEEVYQLLYDLSGQVLNNKVSNPKLLEKWFKQFKKK